MKRCFAAAIGWLSAVPGAAQEKPAPHPTLMVIIVVDQLRADYITAFDANFVSGGFKRLRRHGAWFTNAHFSYGATATGPGHASVLTGATPSVHGIVGNNWYAVHEGGRRRYCCGDDRTHDLGFPAGHVNRGRSPRMLQAPTLGDRLKAHTAGRGKVWSVALKDRSAILTAGKDGDGAVWWDAGSGRYVSSSYFSPSLPRWARRLNESRFADGFFGRPWDRLLPEGAYTVRFLDAPGNDGPYRRFHRAKFPKVLGEGLDRPQGAYYRALYSSPFGNDLVFEAARRVTSAERLGADDDTDLLILCPSSNDVVGHLFGPGSQEVMDCTVRTDRQLADFLAWLDRTIGLERCIVSLTSDHGVGAIPEYAAELGYGGGRLTETEVADYVESGLRTQLDAPAGGPRLVRGVVFPWLYLDESAVRGAGAEVDKASRLAAVIACGHEGIAQTFAAGEIRSPRFGDGGGLPLHVRNSYYPSRSGHVYLHWNRYWYREGANVAGHGAAYEYDRHVPVMIMGQGIRPGRYSRRVCPTGLIVTLCEVLGVAPPAGATGEVYHEALLPSPSAMSGSPAAVE